MCCSTEGLPRCERPGAAVPAHAINACAAAAIVAAPPSASTMRCAWPSSPKLRFIGLTATGTELWPPGFVTSRRKFQGVFSLAWTSWETRRPSRTRPPPRLNDATLLTAIYQNLISNALGKRRESPGLVIRAGIDCRGGSPVLSVEDNGEMIPPALAAQLFREPVESRSGLGIGLFQAARLAAVSGWALRLSENRSGRVAFTLARRPPSARPGDGSSSGPSP